MQTVKHSNELIEVEIAEESHIFFKSEGTDMFMPWEELQTAQRDYILDIRGQIDTLCEKLSAYLQRHSVAQ